MAKLFPSLISADLLALRESIRSLDPWCSGYHLDIMDNHFVANLTWGPMFIDAIAQATNNQLWVHLMVDDPVLWLTKLPVRDGTVVSFHIESSIGVQKIIDDICAKKWLPSLAISPKKPLEKILPFLGSVYQVLVMSVEPGFSGQLFMPEAIGRLETVAEYRAKNKLSFRLAVDGGIKESMIADLVALGVDDFAIASGIFGESDPVGVVKRMSILVE